MQTISDPLIPTSFVVVVVVYFCLLALLLVDLYRIEKVPFEHKLPWALALVFLGIFAMPFYFWWRLRRF